VASEPSAHAPLALWENLFLGVSHKRALRLVPGVLLALSVMLLAEQFSIQIGRVALRLQGIDPTGRPSAISAITCSIIIGLTVGNLVGVHPVFRSGLDLSVKKLLRLGIILVGIKLSLLDVVRLGIWGVPVVVFLIVTALLLTTWITRRLGLSERLGILAAASTAICGVTAAVAVAPTVEADEKELAYTVANVTIFGMLAMFVYPYLAHYLFGAQSGSAGLFLGTAIHDTSQVMGAALAYKDVFGDELALKVATITKLTRNVFLAAVVPLLAYYFSRKRGGVVKKVSIGKLFPLFVLGFLAMAIGRSIGDAGATGKAALAYGIWNPAAWTHLTKMLGEGTATIFLGTAMAAVGLSTNLKALRGLGLKPLYVGAASATIVGGVGLMLAALLGPRINMSVSSTVAATAPKRAEPVMEAPRSPPPPEPEPVAPVVAAVPPGAGDADHDGIADLDDACPHAEGPDNKNPLKRGCPKARVEDSQIRLREPIKFERNTAKISPESAATLRALLALLKDHPEIHRISIDGYMDNRGSERRQVALSRKRAAAVARWLTQHRVSRTRLQFAGFGSDQPVDSNDTREGRRNNRRIEIHIVDSADGHGEEHQP
jgi:uncharacterized integral membrane protein (TIGR00698 family)